VNRLRRVYFETSALNAFAEDRNVHDAIATKAFQNLKGQGFYLSPVALWEVLLTSDEVTRERLIQFAQHLVEPDLLPSPEELVVKYIRSGCPLVEAEYLLISPGKFAPVWRDMCAIKEKTLVFDPSLVRAKTDALRDIGRLFHEFTSFNSIDIAAKPGIAGTQVSVQQVLDRYSVVPPECREDFETVRHIRLVAFFILVFLCAGASVEQEVVEDFWRQQGARTMLERIEVVFSSFPQLVLRGPFNQMAHMAQFQSAKKLSLGVYFDCMHAVYSLYADVFISADEHFRAFREKLRDSVPHVIEIHHFDELRFTTTPRDNPPTESFLLR